MEQLGSSHPFQDLSYLAEALSYYNITDEDIWVCDRANDFSVDWHCGDCSECPYNPNSRKPRPPRPEEPKPKPSEPKPLTTREIYEMVMEVTSRNLNLFYDSWMKERWK